MLVNVCKPPPLPTMLSATRYFWLQGPCLQPIAACTHNALPWHIPSHEEEADWGLTIEWASLPLHTPVCKSWAAWALQALAVSLQGVHVFLLLFVYPALLQPCCATWQVHVEPMACAMGNLRADKTSPCAVMAPVMNEGSMWYMVHYQPTVYACCLQGLVLGCTVQTCASWHWALLSTCNCLVTWGRVSPPIVGPRPLNMRGILAQPWALRQPLESIAWQGMLVLLLYQQSLMPPVSYVSPDILTVLLWPALCASLLAKQCTYTLLSH